MNAMTAAVYYGAHDIRIGSRTRPQPGPGEVLVRVAAVGICGTDLAEWMDGPHLHPLLVAHPVSGHVGPIVPGHEFSGTIVAIGAHVDETMLGTEIASCGADPCGACEPCRDGRSNQCERYVGVGLQCDGALAEYVVTPAASCLPTADLGLTLDEAALCQPMSIAVHAVRRAGDVRGARVAVVGVGGIGIFVVAALVAFGAEVTAVDLDPERVALARRFGASSVLVPSELDAVPERFPVVLEISGSAAGLESALALSARGGAVVLVGLQHGLTGLDLASVTLDERILIGTNAMVRERDFPTAVELVARYRGSWDAVAPRVLPLADLVEQALEPMSRRRAPALKILIDPSATLPRDFRSSPQSS